MVNKEVIVAVRGGVATVVKQPEDVDVHIRDYDFQTSHEDPESDSNGDEYILACDCCS